MAKSLFFKACKISKKGGFTLAKTAVQKARTQISILIHNKGLQRIVYVLFGIFECIKMAMLLPFFLAFFFV